MTTNKDPLQGWSLKRIWLEAVWHSGLPMSTRITLQCVGRFFDQDCKASDMAFSQIAAQTGGTKPTAISAVQYATFEGWFVINRKAGFKTTKGFTHRYNGALPEGAVDHLRGVLMGAVKGQMTPTTRYNDFTSRGKTALPLPIKDTSTVTRKKTSLDGDSRRAGNVIPFRRREDFNDLLVGGAAS